MLLNNKLSHKEWSSNAAVSTRTIILLELVKALERKGWHALNSKVQIGFDNMTSHKKIVSQITKVSILAQDTGAKIAQIQTLIKKIKFRIDMLLLKKHEC